MNMSLAGTTSHKRRFRTLRVDGGGCVAHGLGGSGHGGADLGGGCFEHVRRPVGNIADDFALHLMKYLIRYLMMIKYNEMIN